MIRKTKGLRLYYMDLLWTAKKLNMIAKSPFISKHASWEASMEAKRIMDKAEFYRELLASLKEDNNEHSNIRHR